jgi:hypothetical protein
MIVNKDLQDFYSRSREGHGLQTNQSADTNTERHEVPSAGNPVEAPQPIPVV